MALDPALAGFLGAIIGGAATFSGTLVANLQQARRAGAEGRQARKTEAYGNSLRSLLRAAHRRTLVTGEGRPTEEYFGGWLDDCIEAEYWLTILTTACGAKYQKPMREVNRALLDAMDAMNTEERILDFDLLLRRSYRAVSEAARDDIGFVG
jgi:hypothetical protein